MSRTYFTDRDLGKRFGEILKAGGLTIERHADHFAPNTPDEDWLAEVGKRGWIALTHDRRIRYKPNERDAVMRHRVALLVIVGNAPFKSSRTRLSRQSHASNNSFRAIARLSLKVYRPPPNATAQSRATGGRIELWYPQ